MSKIGFHGCNLVELAAHLLREGPTKLHATPRRVRVIHNHTIIVDTVKALHVWEHDAYPQYYFPLGELKNCSTKDKKEVADDGKTGAAVVELTISGRKGIETVTTDRILRFIDGNVAGVLAGLVRLEFGSMDQWLEEDVPIYVHPKDPFKRVEILHSSRPIEVKVGGKTVAKSANSVHLLETSLPTRYYIPLAAVDQSVLRKSDSITQCPYKGDAEYFNVVVDEEERKDLVWYYRLPTHESAQVAGLVCFYNEKVDIVLDGELQDRPKTFFS